MAIALNQIGQIALTVDNVDTAEKYYSQVLGLRKLYRFGDLLFYDCAGTRLLVEKSNTQPFTPCSSILYFRVADISLTFKEFESRGVEFIDNPHLVAPMEDFDLWMVFFKDPAGNTLALIQEAHKGYKLPSE